MTAEISVDAINGRLRRRRSFPRVPVFWMGESVQLTASGLLNDALILERLQLEVYLTNAAPGKLRSYASQIVKCRLKIVVPFPSCRHPLLRQSMLLVSASLFRQHSFSAVFLPPLLLFLGLCFLCSEVCDSV